MLLSQLNVGEKAKVVKLKNSPEICQRLNNMGLTRGVTVKIIRFASFKGPIEIEVRGFNLALRYSESKKIVVEREL